MHPSHTSESFRGLLLRHRGRVGLTQRDLAGRAGVSLRSMQDWEAGLTVPTAARLQALIEALLVAGGLTPGRELAEARELWSAAEGEGSRTRASFDMEWFDGLLALHGSAPAAPPPQPPVLTATAAGRTVERGQDWGEAPDTTRFVGRHEELNQLRRWALEQGCRVVAVLGIGGIGKTTLAARLAQEVAPGFERVYWRSLRNALPASEWLAGAIAFLSDQQLVPPAFESQRITGLLQLLRERRCLLVLDNSETLFEPGQREGEYRTGMEGYGRILQSLGEASHQSCLLLTSREAPPELALLGAHVRSLEIHGLAIAEAQELLADKQLFGDAEAWVRLVERYDGNGLALKIVSETIREVYDGDVAAFLDEAIATYGTVFGGIRRLLDAQAKRLSPVERDILMRLAVEREPVGLTELSRDMAPSVGRSTVVEGIENLRRRSLVEPGERGSTFTLQSMVLEYVTDQLIETVADEISRGQPVVLVEQPLIKAQAKEYVRQTQERLIGAPILQRLRGQHAEAEVEHRLLALLEAWRGRPTADQRYGPGNVVNLLRLAHGGLCNLDLTRLEIRQAYLAGVEAQDASLAGAHLSETMLADAFNNPISIALSGDGLSLVAGTSTGEVWLWRVPDRTPLLAVQGHTRPLYSVSLSEDGRTLVSGGEDGAVRLWAAPSGQSLAVLQGHAGGVWGVAQSADGLRVASGSFDGTVRVWQTPDGRLLWSLQGHAGPVYGVAMSADGRLVASGGEDGRVRLWEATSGRLLSTLEGHAGGIRGVALSADGRLLATGGRDETIRLWDLPVAGQAASRGQALATLQGHAGVIYAVSLSADGRLLASGSQDGTIRLWEAPSGRTLAALEGHLGGVRGVALSADARLLASGGLDGAVRLWEPSSRRLLATLQGQASVVYGLSMSADGRLLAGGSLDGTIRLWDSFTGQQLANLQGTSGLIHAVALSADGRLLASGSWNGTLQLWDARGRRLEATVEGHAGGVRALALSADGRLLASGGLDGLVRLWDSPSGRPRATLHAHKGGVRGIALSANGQRLASTGWDETIRLWDASADGRLLGTLQGHTGPVFCAALSADGALLASGGEDATVRLWETSTGNTMAALQTHTDGVRSVALSADGQLLAAGSRDGTIHLWDAPTQRPLAIFQGLAGGLWGVALSADGRLLASGGFDGTIRLWETPDGTYLRTLRSDRRYERVDITDLTGVTEAQRTALLALGAVERPTLVPL